MYHFDTYTDRKNTRATKWERYCTEYGNKEYYPLWLADMDFPVSDSISRALIERAEHPIYGYTDRTEKDRLLFTERFNTQHGYDMEINEVILSTGVMYSLAASILLFTEPEDSILIITPCYPPFITAVTGLKRKALMAPMKFCGGKYCMDMELLHNIVDHSVKAVILCNPHNPTGRVFSLEELKQLALFCEDRRLLIFSDEIHSDFIYPPAVFHPIMMINNYTREHTVAMVSPTKSFNLAGLKISAVFIKNRSMNQKFTEYASLRGIGSINLFALEALRAAYTDSKEWQEALIQYLITSRKKVSDYLKQNLPEVEFAEPEGTYFYWLNFKKCGFFTCGIHHTLMKKGGVILNEGNTFGEIYTGFERMNIACPQPFLTQALEKISNCMKEGE